ncbi:DnAJ-like protein [Glycine max]|uniref:Chaperone protein DnaJ isoform B n=1 Tax=Glycine soja TaxID=3848 RepID=A0A445HJ96_GLYSO|nr:DnAJ-like protein [Glycine max]RZB73761.1 Chaperone protein DnaJ isoform B [Glycine soja]
MAAADNTNPKDYYKVLEVEYDATDENIKLNYRRLALKWHPDKHGGDSAVTAKFQEIIEAYNVLSDPAKRLDYDLTGICEIEKYSLQEYLARFKSMILTCNGLGINQTDRWMQLDVDVLKEYDNFGRHSFDVILCNQSQIRTTLNS